MTQDPPPSFGLLNEKLEQLYGIEFPASLFFLHEFLCTYRKEENTKALDATGIHATGVLEVLGRIVEGRSVSTPKPILLHFRFHHDLPEFFTCLFGDTDGLHWGLLLDEPMLGFRGAASYYNNDGDKIQVCRGLFDALLTRIDRRIESTNEMIQDDPEHEQDYHENVTFAGRIKERLQEFVDRHAIRLDDHRPPGVESDTGLDLIVGQKYIGHDADAVPQTPEHWQAISREEANELLAGCNAGRVVPAMRAGRSLWYWGGDEHSATAYALLRASYEALERPELIRVLDVHYQTRNMKSVDLLPK